MSDDPVTTFAPPIVYPTHARPLVEVCSDGSWALAEVRMWHQGRDGWRAEVQRIGAGERAPIETVPSGSVRTVDPQGS